MVAEIQLYMSLSQKKLTPVVKQNSKLKLDMQTSDAGLSDRRTASISNDTSNSIIRVYMSYSVGK